MTVYQKDSLEKSKTLLGVRHLQTLMLFIGMMILYCMKVSMSIAIVAMTDHTQDNIYNWNHQIQSVILSSFEWGFVVLKVPGAEAAARYGGKVVMIFCTALNSAATVLLPLAAYYGGWKAVCGCRLVQGLAQGVLLPTIHNLIAKWAPLEEMSRTGTILYAGGQLGTALQLSTGGYIANYWGWPAIFYSSGTIGVIWTFIYLIFGSSSPQDSKTITIEERNYIEASLGHVDGRKRVKTPWKALFTSFPFIALILVNIGCSWGYWTILTETPTYMRQIYGINLKANGVISALPYFTACLMCFPFGILSDYILKKKLISVTACRKLCNSLGMFGPAVCLVILSHVSGDMIAVVSLLSIGVGLNSGRFSGFHLVFLDMAPNHAGTMLAITYTFANILSICAPLAAGFLVLDETSPYEWRKVFYLAAILYATTNLFYLVFGTSERQKWNDPVKDEFADTKETNVSIS